MKINVSETNNRIIASGSAFGRKIKAIAVCNEPTFDEGFGTELVKMKYGIAKKKAQIQRHKQAVSGLKDLVRWCQKQLDYEATLISNMEKNVDARKAEMDKLLEVKFG